MKQPRGGLRKDGATRFRWVRRDNGEGFPLYEGLRFLYLTMPVVPTDAPMCVRNVRKKLKLHLLKKRKARGKYFIGGMKHACYHKTILMMNKQSGW